MKQSEIALKLAEKVYAGVFRNDGITPYLTHPQAVAKMLDDNGYGDDYIAVALLHDTLEDNLVNIATLFGVGLNANVIDGIQTLTHEKNEPYLVYVRKVLETKWIAVKYFDIVHNSATNPSEWAKNKYKKALLAIEEVYPAYPEGFPKE